LWPSWSLFVAVMVIVCGHHGHCLWPSWSLFVAVMVCRHDCPPLHGFQSVLLFFCVSAVIWFGSSSGSGFSRSQSLSKTSIKPVIFDHLEESLEDAATVIKLRPSMSEHILNHTAV